MNMSEHKCADVLRAIANGDDVEFEVSTLSGLWRTCGKEHALAAISEGIDARIKPHTIKVGNREVPEPMRVKPKCGETYFCISNAKVFSYGWSDDTLDNRIFNAGLCFKTKEDAQAALDAITELFKGE